MYLRFLISFFFESFDLTTTLLQHPPYISSGEYMNPYFYNRERLFVSPSISDSMKTSAYYKKNRNLAYLEEGNIAELVGTSFKNERWQGLRRSHSRKFLSCILWDGGRS
jgi:hypothetical protein